MGIKQGVGALRPASAHAPSVSKRWEILRYWQLYLLLLVPLLFLVAFNYLPMLGAIIAFKNFNIVQGIWGSPWVGLQNFEQFFASPYFDTVIRNTLVISVYSLMVGIPAPVILALALNQIRNGWFKSSVQLLTFSPYFISVVVLVGMIQIVFSPEVGVVGNLFHMVGISNPINILGIPRLFSSVYAWSGVWQGTGYGAVIYLAALANANPELYEAATVDGASRWQKIRHIDLQAIKPTFVILTVLAAGQIMAVGFEKVYLLQNPLNLSASEVISTYVYKVGILGTNFSFATAVGLFNSVINFALILVVNWVARRIGETSLW